MEEGGEEVAAASSAPTASSFSVLFLYGVVNDDDEATDDDKDDEVEGGERKGGYNTGEGPRTAACASALLLFFVSVSVCSVASILESEWRIAGGGTLFSPCAFPSCSTAEDS